MRERGGGRGGGKGVRACVCKGCGRENVHTRTLRAGVSVPSTSKRTMVEVSRAAIAIGAVTVESGEEEEACGVGKGKRCM